MNTIAFITNQYSCERIITSAKKVAEENGSPLVVVGILSSEYEMNPNTIDFLFSKSKEHGATMRLLFSDDVTDVMHDVISQYDCGYVVTGMPSTNRSVVYELWKTYDSKQFYTVDIDGEVVEVANTELARSGRTKA